MDAARGGALKNLAHHDGCQGGEEGDSEGGAGILSLGHRQTGDHAGAETGHRELAGDFAAGARGGSHEFDASGRKLPAVAGPEHEGRRSCYGLFGNFMVLLQSPAARRPGRAAGPGLAVAAGDGVGDLFGDRRGGQPGHQRSPQEGAVVVEGALVLVSGALFGQAHHLAGAGMEGLGLLGGREGAAAETTGIEQDGACTGDGQGGGDFCGGEALQAKGCERSRIVGVDGEGKSGAGGKIGRLRVVI